MIPSLFISHSWPMLALEHNRYTEFLERLAAAYPAPKAIVLFSAHWESEVLTIGSSDDVFETIYDFGGFAPELYTLKYPARGSTAIAAAVRDAFGSKSIEARLDSRRGLDHGVWIILKRMFPEADIPVVPVSVHPFLPPERQLAIGEALRGFGDDNIFVVGSGSIAHQFGFGMDPAMVRRKSMEFEAWIIEKTEQRDIRALLDYRKLAPHASFAVPRPEHFVPLLIALGSGGDAVEPKTLYREQDAEWFGRVAFQFYT
ncbi:dioxygenase [Paenibacillus ginsengarvi]|uniref:Dioxygenase n=1 Tax=Paenibacillus ginsengarvi TaxID=400777 RepID=A0A3B0BE88_9BACL|nr:class III extradiol ring-cleavage dioxygenase [Paenibacillus ginsengarvi]RKN70644.1 dioxygenase [Paenibacillus ginsengarvi]